MDKKLKYNDLPPSWVFCMNDECPMHEKCIRWQSSLVLPEDRLTATCVLPAAAKLDSCPHYKEMREVRLAWGLNNMLSNLKVGDSNVVRKKLWDILGSRTTFYRYNNGEMLLTPELQEKVLELFGSYGYADGLEFDNYVDGYDI